MKPNNSNDHGIVYRKTSGHYHVHTGARPLTCVLSSHLRQEMADPVAVGDRVRYETAIDGTGRILEILPRRNKLSRPATGPGAGRTEQVIAANLDQVIPVFSTTRPIPKWGLLDRYLVCASAADIPAVICITKTDLCTEDADLEAWLQIYQAIGYPVVRVSARTGEGLDDVRDILRDHCSVLVGKSGVGKTTLLNALQPGLGLRVQAVTRGHKGKGRHTTTSLEMFPLESGGSLVDTPGIREFGLWDLYRDELAWFFPEMRPYVGSCKFGLDCQHVEEPGCAIRAAVMAGQVNPYRYRSYLRLWEELP